jgi:kinesin family protein 11
MNEREMKHSTLPVIKASTVDKTVTVIKGQGNRQARSTFSFDNVFTAFSSQEEVFEATLKPVIRDVLTGYESTIFAYGQTGTGKTHTMEGSLSSPPLYGIIPRSAQAIFEAVKRPDFENTVVLCSYLEIYNEDLGDLLSDENGDDLSMAPCSTPGMKKKTSPPRRKHASSSPKRKKSKLEIMEGPDGPFCRGLKEIEVSSASDVLHLMQNAQHQRKVGETKMNKHSSRSHCLFTMEVKSQRRLKDGSVIDFSGKLHMVDLAGSECAKNAGFDKSEGGGEQVARERERMNINRSLLTLGRVIKLLKEQSQRGSSKKNSVRIPYRDSKLTRILQESLGGRCKTLIVATLSPSVTAIEESLSTLHYAQSASGIVNKPISSSKMSINSVAYSGDAGSTEVGSVDSWYEMECRLEYMHSQVEEAQAALARKHLQQQDLSDRAEKAESDLVLKEFELSEVKGENAILKKEVANEREQREALAFLQRKTETDLKQTTAILEATKCTEVCLTKEAQGVLGALEASIGNGEHLQSQLSEARDDAVDKRNITKKFHTATVLLLNTVVAKLKEFPMAEEMHKSEIVNLTAIGRQREESSHSCTIELVQGIKHDVERMTNTIKQHINGDEGMSGILTNMASIVEEKSQVAKSSIEDGEDALSTAFDDTLERLKGYSDQIKSMNSDFLFSSQTIASSIETNICECKEQMVAFVALATQSLGDVSDANTRSHDQLSSVLKDILESTASSSMSISKQAEMQREYLSTSLKSFESGMRYNNMNSEIAKHNLILKEQGSAHMKQIADLKEIVKTQELSFEEAAVNQRAIQEETLKNIFKGVQNLVTEGIGHLAHGNEVAHQTFSASNEVMMQANYATQLSAENIFSGMKAATDTLEKDVESAQENDIMIGQTVQETSSVIQELANSVISQKSHIDSVVDSGTICIQDLTQNSAQMACIVKQLDADKDDVGGFIYDTVLSEAKVGVETLRKSTAELSEFASRTILNNVQNDINAMRKPRDEWKAGTIDCVDKISSAVHDSSLTLGSTMQMQDHTASELVQCVASKHDDFVNIQSLTRLQEIEQHEVCIRSELEKHMSSTVEVMTDCTSGLNTTEGQVKKYSKIDMRCDETVKPLGKILQIDYNSKFTSTPADDEIIEGLDLSFPDTLKDLSAAAAVEDADDESMKSAEETVFLETDTNPIPRPPTASTSLGKENVQNRNQFRKERSRSRTGKRRAHSRPRETSTSRKRVPNMSTPTRL